MTTDAELLRQFVRTNAGDAFAELVRRHVSLVYATALRQVNGDEHLAKDVAQTVFTDLARKAGSLAHQEILTGWLYTSAHFAAAKMIRTEIRRRDREEKFMREPSQETAPAPEWEHIRPALDDVMHELKAADREIILLRYFENRPFAEVGAKLGLNENAARMRVERALEKMRAIFTKRGITTTTALAAVLSANAVPVAPAGLAAALTSTSLAAAGTGTFTLIKLMTMTNLKLGLSTIVIAGAATALVAQHQSQASLRDQNQALQQQVTQLQSDNESFSNRLATAGDGPKLTGDQLNELLKLRGEVGMLREQAGQSQKSSDSQLNEVSQKLQAAEANLKRAASARAFFEGHQTALVNGMKLLGISMRIYAGDHNGQYPTNLEQVAAAQQGSYKIGGVDLYSFEFVNTGVPHMDDPHILEMRERLVRQAPDGSWSRLYGFADGSVQIATSYDGNFDAWEKANTAAPAAGQ